MYQVVRLDTQVVLWNTESLSDAKKYAEFHYRRYLHHTIVREVEEVWTTQTIGAALDKPTEQIWDVFIGINEVLEYNFFVKAPDMPTAEKLAWVEMHNQSEVQCELTKADPELEEEEAFKAFVVSDSKIVLYDSGT